MAACDFSDVLNAIQQIFEVLQAIFQQIREIQRCSGDLSVKLASGIRVDSSIRSKSTCSRVLERTNSFGCSHYARCLRHQNVLNSSLKVQTAQDVRYIREEELRGVGMTNFHIFTFSTAREVKCSLSRYVAKIASHMRWCVRALSLLPLLRMHLCITGGRCGQFCV